VNYKDKNYVLASQGNNELGSLIQLFTVKLWDISVSPGFWYDKAIKDDLKFPQLPWHIW
jgi:hypothetical protein